MQSQAPGKLILSGEHSVVYGAPALAVPTAQKISLSFESDTSTSLHLSSALLGDSVISLADLTAIPERLDSRFNDFLQHEISIARVLSSAFDLICYTLARHGFKQPGTLRISSEVPLGAGMGSSAALICALIKLCKLITGQSVNAAQLFQQVRYCERLQHGRGSAIDAAAVSYAKAVKVQAEQVTPLALTLDKHWFLYNSGQPQSSTGEAVAEVRRNFANASIWQEFAEVTLGFEKALAGQNPAAIMQNMKANQGLLENIGVVPEPVQNLIRSIEAEGAAAKICGAGSTSGESAGMVLIYSPNVALGPLREALGINIEPLPMAGAHT